MQELNSFTRYVSQYDDELDLTHPTYTRRTARRAQGRPVLFTAIFTAIYVIATLATAYLIFWR